MGVIARCICRNRVERGVQSSQPGSGFAKRASTRHTMGMRPSRTGRAAVCVPRHLSDSQGVRLRSSDSTHRRAVRRDRRRGQSRRCTAKIEIPARGDPAPQVWEGKASAIDTSERGSNDREQAVVLGTAQRLTAAKQPSAGRGRSREVNYRARRKTTANDLADRSRIGWIGAGRQSADQVPTHVERRAHPAGAVPIEGISNALAYILHRRVMLRDKDDIPRAGEGARREAVISIGAAWNGLNSASGEQMRVKESAALVAY